MQRIARPAFSGLVFVLLAIIASNSAVASPRDWLKRMGDAVELRNYRGTLVHMSDGQADVLQIVHRVDENGVTARITANQGAGREIIRDNDEVTCIFPDQKVVIVEERDDRDSSQSPLGGRLPSHQRISEKNYELISQGKGKMTGRSAEIIAIRPRDSYRYGYRLWLDQPTAMPLKSQLLDEQGMVVDEIMFSEISLPDEIELSHTKPSLEIESFTWRRSEPMDEQPSKINGGRWRATELPDGFMLAAVRSKAGTGTVQPMEQLVYSDGLASVSVFIEPGVAAAEQAEGRSRIGAANAYTTTMEGRLVTAVGEVPVKTAKMIALSVRPISDAP